MAQAPLVSPEWLHDRLAAPDIVVLDTSWYLPAAGRDPEAEFRAAHIPGARRFDLDAMSDTESNLPHMLPRPEVFAAMYPRLEEWRQVQAHVDPGGVLHSDLSRRLGLTAGAR